jgi:hypothetical protein
MTKNEVVRVMHLAMYSGAEIHWGHIQNPTTRRDLDASNSDDAPSVGGRQSMAEASKSRRIRGIWI